MHAASPDTVEAVLKLDLALSHDVGYEAGRVGGDLCHRWNIKVALRL